MRLRSIAVGLLATVGGDRSAAAAQSCQQLWVERNSYYKARRLLLQDPAGHRLFRQWRLHV